MLKNSWDTLGTNIASQYLIYGTAIMIQVWEKIFFPIIGTTLMIKHWDTSLFPIIGTTSSA